MEMSSLCISLTVFDSDGKNIQSCYVRKLTGAEVNTKDSNSLIEWIDYFLVADNIPAFNLIEYSPFGKWMKVVYDDGTISNQILLTWEHFK